MRTCTLLSHNYVSSFRHICRYPVNEPLLGNSKKIDFTMGTKCSNFSALYVIFYCVIFNFKTSGCQNLASGETLLTGELPSNFFKW